MKLDFIGIGVPKAGTTWISQCLDEHPEICHAHRFETVFFENDSLYKKGAEYLEKEFFNHCKAEKVKGEITPTYLYSRTAAERIQKHNPNIKLIVCLRNPADRAYSHYTAQERHGKPIVYGMHSFEDIRHRHENPYFQRGFYFQHITQYYNLFNKKNICILLHDDMVRDPKDFMQSIYEFLGVEKNVIPPSLFKKVHATETRGVYSKTLNQWLLYGKLGAKLSKLPLYKPFRQLLKKTGIFTYGRKAVGRLNVRRKPWKRSPMPEHTRMHLKKAYRKDIEQLEKLIGKNLDSWK